MMLQLLDIACFVLHTLLIAFNIVGWAWRRTRLPHLICFGLTAVSWFLLGAWYGWGYCICADWHFQIRRELGHADVDSSYVQLLSRHVCGLPLSRDAADWIAGIVFVLIAVATAIIWTRTWFQGERRAD
jgi:hypothetical protein